MVAQDECSCMVQTYQGALHSVIMRYRKGSVHQDYFSRDCCALNLREACGRLLRVWM